MSWTPSSEKFIQALPKEIKIINEQKNWLRKNILLRWNTKWFNTFFTIMNTLEETFGLICNAPF